MSFSPLTGLAYIPGQEGSRTFGPDPNFVYKPGGYDTAMAGARRPMGEDGLLAPAVPVEPGKEPDGADKEPQASGGVFLPGTRLHKKKDGASKPRAPAAEERW
jgi:hypothetical protein